MAERRDPGAATEPPSERRLREARQAGQVAHSHDLTAAVGAAIVLAVLAVGAPAAVSQLWRYFRSALGAAGTAGRVAQNGGGGTAPGDALSVAGAAAVSIGVPLVLVPALVALAAAVLVGAVQTGGVFSWTAARPSAARVGPRAWVRRLVGPEAAGGFARAAAKLALLIAVGVAVLAPLVAVVPRLVRCTPAAILSAVGVLALRVATPLVIAAMAWGTLDWMLARWRHGRALAMTRDESRRERREREGDPLRRAERRRSHRALAEAPVPEDARAAALIIAGPGPVAVALGYDPAAGRAPVVVVSGREGAAEQILAVAHAADVRVADDGGLAAVLLEVEVGHEIPDACFEAVAALLP